MEIIENVKEMLIDDLKDKIIYNKEYIDFQQNIQNQRLKILQEKLFKEKENSKINQLSKEINEIQESFNIDTKEKRDVLIKYTKFLEDEDLEKNLFFETEREFQKNIPVFDINNIKDEKYLQLNKELFDVSDNQELDNFGQEMKKIKIQIRNIQEKREYDKNYLINKTNMEILQLKNMSTNSKHIDLYNQLINKLEEDNKQYEKLLSIYDLINQIENIKHNPRFLELIDKKNNIRNCIKEVQRELKNQFDIKLDSMLKNTITLYIYEDKYKNKLKNVYVLYKVKPCESHSNNFHPDNCNLCINCKIYYL